MFDAFSLCTCKDLSALYDPALSMSLCIFIIICCRMCSFSCLSFSFILFCVFSLDIFDTDFWSSCLIVSREVASFMEKLKFTALATRASRTSINYTRVFNRWRSFSADVLVIFSSGFWSSGSSDDCQVNKLKQKLKLTVLAPRASETSENYLKAFNRWAEFPLFLSVSWIVPSICSFFYSHQSWRLPSTALFTLSSGCIRLEERILLPDIPPLSPRRREFFVLLANQPPIEKNTSRWPISSNLLKGLTLAIFCN